MTTKLFDVSIEDYDSCTIGNKHNFCCSNVTY
jgi:hypothetical protein